MKTVEVPFLDQLDSVDLANSAKVLVESGKRIALDSVNWPTQYPYKPITYCIFGRSDSSLFLRFYVWGNVLKASYYTDQSPVHEDSCVEFFCRIPGNEEYSNFEFNCIGTCSASKRKGRKLDVRPFSTDEMKTIKRLPSIPVKAFNELSGQFEWDLTVEIPFKLIGIDANHLPTSIEGNFYKCADKTEYPHFISWNPIETDTPDFHRPEFFGKLIF